MATKPHQRPAEPLRTRHVFLDTQVYRRYGFNLSNSALTTLLGYVDEGKISLHTTEITLLESRRQIREQTEETAANIKKLHGAMNRMKQMVPGTAIHIPEFDGASASSELFNEFQGRLISFFRAHRHNALEVRPRVIFERYFDGQPPFESRSSKEFPDAFVLEALNSYCAENRIKMYVVTGDNVMRDSAASRDHLIPAHTLEDILSAVVADFDGNAEAIADALFSDPAFDYRLETALKEEVDALELRYEGDLEDGEASDPTLRHINELSDYSVVALDDQRISLILTVNAEIDMQIAYDDHSEAWDDDLFLGGSRAVTTSSSTIQTRLFVTLDRSSGEFLEVEMLNQQVGVT